MVLDQHRAVLDWWLVPLAKACRNINPNTITWISFAFAVAGGLAFWQSGPEALWLLWVAALCTIANGVLDVLDGKVATITGRMTPKGDYLDHALDRFSDAVLIAGIAFSPWARMEWGLLAIIGTLLTSYLGTQAQAIGLGRNYGGMLGRADRLVIMMAVPMLTAVLYEFGITFAYGRIVTSLPEAMLAYFGIAGMISVLQRFVSGLRGFGPDGHIKP